jgi:NAD(P)-dependent dehydrogenase (short-subunit alcohol dehydrogenase family)
MNSLITGANRGIGLEYVRQLLEVGDQVFAASRKPAKAKELLTLQKKHPNHLHLIKLDVRKENQIASAVDQVAQKIDSLDLLINNAGIYPRGEHLGTLNSQQMIEAFQTNTVAPILVVQAFQDLLNKAQGKVINISSGLGSLAMTTNWGHSYRASKAGLNMYSRVLADELRSSGVIVIVMHPGWVKTDMGGQGAHLTVNASVAGQLNVIRKLKLEDSGLFFREDGEQVAW